MYLDRWHLFLGYVSLLDLLKMYGCYHVYICVQTKEFAAPDVAGQTEQVMKNLGAILTAAGTSYDKIVKTTILLADMSDFATVNEVYGKYFPSNPPARATFAVKGLPLGALVEIDAVALE
jgi:2-iminobutanoate/2-iminopropanoate deaminase